MRPTRFSTAPRARDEAHKILKYWANLENKGHLAKKETALDAGFLREGLRRRPRLPVAHRKPRRLPARTQLHRPRRRHGRRGAGQLHARRAAVAAGGHRVEGRRRQSRPRPVQRPHRRCSSAGTISTPCPTAPGASSATSSPSGSTTATRRRWPTRSSRSRTCATTKRSASSTASSSAAGWSARAPGRPLAGHRTAGADREPPARSRRRTVRRLQRQPPAAHRAPALQARARASTRRSTSPSKSSTASSSSPSARTATCCRRSASTGPISTLPPFSKVTNPRWRNFLDLFRGDGQGPSRHASAWTRATTAACSRDDPEVDDLQLDDEWTNFFQRHRQLRLPRRSERRRPRPPLREVGGRTGEAAPGRACSAWWASGRTTQAPRRPCRSRPSANASASTTRRPSSPSSSSPRPSSRSIRRALRRRAAVATA